MKTKPRRVCNWCYKIVPLNILGELNFIQKRETEMLLVNPDRVTGTLVEILYRILQDFL